MTRLLMICLTFPCWAGASAKAPFNIADAQKAETFVSHAEWLGLALPVAPFTQLKSHVETQTHSTLKDRGEAHITILTPPEFSELKGALTMAAIEQAIKEDLRKARWTPVCVGRGINPKDPKQETYFLVVDSPDLVQIRTKISQLAKNPKSFDPSHFYPHVTLGFTEKDLHEQDGIIKDRRSCFLDLAL